MGEITAMMKACEDGKEKIVGELIHAGADVNAASSEVQSRRQSQLPPRCFTISVHIMK